MITVIVIAVVVILIIAFVLVYNSLVKLRVNAEEALSDIDVQLKRRHDLIPNLVETVKGYASHESSVFEEVTKARTRAVDSSPDQNMKESAAAEEALSSALVQLNAVAEQYPDLKASSNFIELQQELTGTEDKIAASRRYYNTSVRALNTKTQQFPSSIAARVGGFKEKEFFEMEENRSTPEVKFVNDNS